MSGAVGDGHEGLEVRCGGFAVDDGDLDGGEACVFDEAEEFDFGEAEPDIGVEVAGLFEVVFEEIEDDDAAAWAGDAEGFADGGVGAGGVVEGLAEEGEVDGGVVEGGGFDVAEAVFEIGDPVFCGDAGAVFDHFFGAIDGDDAFGAACEELGERAFASAEVGDGEAGHEEEEGLGEAFPAAAWAVAAAEFTGELVEVGAGVVGAFAEGEFEAAAVFGGFGDFGGAAADEFGEACGGRVHAVEAVFTGTPGADEACVFEEAELGGDAALFHAEDFLDFGDGEFGAIHEQEQSEPCGLADQAEGFDDGGHGQSKGPGRRSGKEQSSGGITV